MNWNYTYLVSQTLNDKVDLGSLQEEVQSSAITIALDFIDEQNETSIIFYFKAELSDDEEIILDGVVANHTGESIADEIPIVRAETLTEHIKWIESGDVTQNLYAAKSILIDVSTGQLEKIVDLKFPFNISLMSGTLGITEEMIGDELAIEIAPNTLIGGITQSISTGDTSVYVTDSVVNNIKRGYFLSIYDPDGDGNDIGQVRDFCTDQNCISLSEPTDVSINAGTPVAMTIKLVPYLYLDRVSEVEVGKQIPTGQRIPYGTPIRIHYQNKNLLSKKASFFVEYLY